MGKCKRTVRLHIAFLVVILLLSGCGEKSDVKSTRVKNQYSWQKTDTQSKSANMRELEQGLFGRYFFEGSSAVFSWPGNGIEFGFKGTGLTVEFGNSNSGAAVYIDGGEEQYIRVREGVSVKVAEDLAPDEIHCVKIQKRSEPNKGNLVIKSVKIDGDGEFYVKKYENQRKRIEIIGDSVSCGYGNLYGKIEGDHIDTEDGTKTYATMLADYYDAEISVCAISGIGIGKDEGYPLPVLPEYMKDGDNMHDFSKNIPDVVIIEIGTNDDSCGNTGETFINGVKELVTFVRTNYPDAVIIWFYGMMGDGVASEIEETVKFFNDKGDENIYFLRTYQNDSEPVGEKRHPSLETHIRMKEELADYIDKMNIM